MWINYLLRYSNTHNTHNSSRLLFLHVITCPIAHCPLPNISDWWPTSEGGHVCLLTKLVVLMIDSYYQEGRNISPRFSINSEYQEELFPQHCTHKDMVNPAHTHTHTHTYISSTTHWSVIRNKSINIKYQI